MVNPPQPIGKPTGNILCLPVNMGFLHWLVHLFQHITPSVNVNMLICQYWSIVGDFAFSVPTGYFIFGGFGSIYQHTDVILETTSWYLRCDTNAAEPFVFGTEYMLPDTVVALNCYKCLYFMIDNQLVIGVIPCITV